MATRLNRRQRKERRRISRLAKRGRPAAFEEARELCATVGPAALAAEYGLAPDASLEEIAAGYAAAVSVSETRDHARAGALEGLRTHETAPT